MARKKKNVLRETQLTLLACGLLIGVLFPLFYNFVLRYQSVFFFWLSCIASGLIFGSLAFMVLRLQIVARLQNIYNEIHLMQLRRQFYPLQHNFHENDIFARLLDNLNSLFLFGQEQYSSAYQSALQLVNDRFKFNRRIRQFSNKLEHLRDMLEKMNVQVHNQNQINKKQVEMFLQINTNIQALASTLGHLLEQNGELESYMRQQRGHLDTLIQESQEVENAVLGSEDVHENKAIFELSMGFVRENSRLIDNQAERLEQITNFLQEIEDIAESTHLLSINASIEAARAGETGRSFTIVALQIRNLATKSSSLTKSIREQIDDISKLSRNNSYVVDDLRESIVNNGEQLRDSLKRIHQVKEELTEEGQDASPLLSAVSATLDEFSEKMIQLNQIRDSGKQSFDSQQQAYNQLQRVMQSFLESFQTIKEIGEKGLFNEKILQQLNTNIKIFEEMSMQWNKQKNFSEEQFSLS